jgi:hypothetical protein
LPQGLPKKIEFQLLLADLAFQIADALASRRKILHSLRLGRRISLRRAKELARPAGRPQRVRSATAKMPAPLVQMTRRDLQLP